MQFDPKNKVIELCQLGMESESKMEPNEARRIFEQAWNLASNDFEKFTAAHYLARHQPATQEKLSWDEVALAHALKVLDFDMAPNFPSLYLNIAKDYEDLGEWTKAEQNYRLAESFLEDLPEDGYGEMIRSGIKIGIERLARHSN
ncbi:MAG: rRNA adenine methyltransferase [Chitinophagales bacterium]